MMIIWIDSNGSSLSEGDTVETIEDCVHKERNETVVKAGTKLYNIQVPASPTNVSRDKQQYTQVIGIHEQTGELVGVPTISVKKI